MKSVRIAAVLLVVVIAAVVANAIAVRNIIGGILYEVENASEDKYEEIFEHYKSIETYVSLSVDHEDMMNIELVILSDVSQTDKDKYHMILLICGI